MNYKIIVGDYSDDLQYKVQYEIDRGWSPCGGVAFGNGKLYQAMTATDEALRDAARKREC